MRWRARCRAAAPPAAPPSSSPRAAAASARPPPPGRPPPRCRSPSRAPATARPCATFPSTRSSSSAPRAPQVRAFSTLRRRGCRSARPDPIDCTFAQRPLQHVGTRRNPACGGPEQPAHAGTRRGHRDRPAAAQRLRHRAVRRAGAHRLVQPRAARPVAAARRPRVAARTWHCCSLCRETDAQLLDDAAARQADPASWSTCGWAEPAAAGGAHRSACCPTAAAPCTGARWTSCTTRSAEARRLAELLDLAQDFGRLAVWERDAHSLQGRWDRHMYRFWGLSEGDGTPDFDVPRESIVAEDRAGVNQTFRHSIRRAGTYSHRYRVRSADGVVRQVHSQWIVKNGADGVARTRARHPDGRHRGLGPGPHPCRDRRAAGAGAGAGEHRRLPPRPAHRPRQDQRQGLRAAGAAAAGRRPERRGAARAGPPRRPGRPARQPGAGGGHRPAGGRGNPLPPCRRQLAPCAHAPHAAARRQRPAAWRCSAWAWT